MHFRRKRPRDVLYPKKEYRRPQVDRGNFKYSFIGVHKAAARANQQIIEWELPEDSCE